MPDYHQCVTGRRSRRHFLQLVGSAATVTLLTACIRADAPTVSHDTSTPITEKPTTEKKVILFWGDEHHPLDLAAEGFRAAHPELEWQSPHPVDHVVKMKTALASGVDLPDLYWAETPLAQAWGCQKLLANLTERLEPVLADYHPAKVAESFVFRHKRYIGWPGDLGVSGWYYRQDKLDALGWREADLAALTWPAFIAMTAELSAQGLYTYCFPPKGWSPLFFLLLHQVGGTAVREDGKRIMVGGEKGIQAMRLLKKLWEARGGLAVEWQQPPYWTALKAGQLVGDFAPAWARSTWEANLQDGGAAAGLGHWRLAPLPGDDNIPYRTGIWGGAQVVMPKAASNPEGALLFMQYALGSLDGATRVGASSLVPAYRPYLASAAFLAQRSPLFGDWSFGQFWAAQEKELSLAYFRPAGWDAVSAAVQQEMPAIVQDAYSVEDGMSRIVDRALSAFMQTRCG